MKILGALVCATVIIVAPQAASARGSHSGSYGHSHSHYGYGLSRGSLGHSRAVGLRDSRGRLKRSTAAKDAFKRSHPCPSTGQSRGSCPGYVIDHVQPLKRGGPDEPSNMQWQTKEAAKAKDKIE
jgi:hypothetical protein